MFEELRAAYFPTTLVGEIVAQPMPDRATLYQKIGSLFPLIFADTSTAGAYTPPIDRRQNPTVLATAFQQTHQEALIFIDEATQMAVGWSYGEMRDPSTYFMTNTGILPDYQRRGLYSTFLRHLLPYLTTLGYERVTSNHQVNNRAVIIAKLKAGFVITGLNLHEQWGAQVELTWFCHQDREQGFANAFALEDRARA